MRQWSDRIWIAEAPLRFYGVPFGARMTVVRLADGGLLVHSPLDPEPLLRAEIDALGPVRYVVSPNKLHNLYLAGFLQAYPSAQLFAPPGLASKRPDLRFDSVAHSAAEAAAFQRADWFLRGIAHGRYPGLSRRSASRISRCSG